MWLSALGVLGLGITLWFNFRALDLAESEAKDTVGALTIAARNADAAADANRIAQENLEFARQGRRPWIGIENIEIEPMGNGLVRLALVWRNFGDVPALASTKGAARCIPKGFTAPYIPGEDALDVTSIVFPSRHLFSFLVTDWTPERIEELAAEWDIYLYCICDYSNSDGTGAYHTNMTFMWNPKTKNFDTNRDSNKLI